MTYRFYIPVLFLFAIVATAFAQEQERKSHLLTVTFEGVSLQYNADIAENIAITFYSGDLAESTELEFSDTAHFITFQFYDATHTETGNLSPP